ncbi:uncharacterized protein LOC129615462 [Condylostylus longicornis]|uniref:uncharacterized protein LOC129615462 n=1 Tax=Condylostylus longicornis TaxID=2530218 RepID=UPI00244DA6E9|nr:uncharacterized protein LOC129615462 [Condylostylus longicornis]
MKSSLILLAFLCSLQYSWTIKCYMCRSSLEGPCGELLDKKAEKQPFVRIEDCNKKCMTAKYNLRGDRLYERLCTDIDYCKNLKEGHKDPTAICKECTTDLCNTDLF